MKYIIEKKEYRRCFECDEITLISALHIMVAVYENEDNTQLSEQDYICQECLNRINRRGREDSTSSS